MKNILVTGGAGFIGSHTVVELVNAGFKPIIIDNLSNSDRSVLKSLKDITGQDIKFYEHDYQDRELLSKIFKQHKIDGVIHFAAFKAVGESVEKPLKYFKNNVAGLIDLLDAMQDHQIPALVFSSSCVVYGEAGNRALTENFPVQPAASPYGSSKQMGENIIRDTTSASRNLKSISLRYFNPIGAHPSAKIGELPIGKPSILVPFITQTVAGWHKELTVFGDDYPTPDGTCIRDYIHVADLAKAHVQALNHIFKQKTRYYDVFNIGTGKGSSVMEVIKTFEKVTSKKVPYKIGARRPGDIVVSFANADKAKKILGWKAEKTLGDALSDAWRWQQTLSKPSY